MLRCVYVDLDGTLLGRGGSLLHDGEGRLSLLGVRALEACWRADVEVVIYSGRRQAQVFEDARLLGHRAYIFEAGCGLVIDGELHQLVDGFEPSPPASLTVHEQIDALGAPALLLAHFKGRLEPHAPWHLDREVSHLFRGEVDLVEVDRVLRAHGFERLRLVDNGAIARRSPTLPGIERPRAYHLIPAGASKAAAIALHMRMRGYAPAECIAVGDSREDLGSADAVGCFWLVANALERDPGLREELARRANVRVGEERHGAGVYEAVVTTLSEGRTALAR